MRLSDLKSALKIFARNYGWTVLILLIFATIYSLITFVNHYNFRTNAFDLGIYNNTIYDYSKFQINDNPVMHREFDNLLSDHFSLLLMFFAPLRYLFGTYTLLIIQVLSILFGGLGAYRFVYYLTNKKWIANIALIHFLSSFAIFSALSFDYHDNVVGAMFVPWILYSFYRKQWRNTIIFSLLVLISKENMAMWLAFVFLGLLIFRYKDIPSRRFAIGGATVSIAYFILVMGVVMPALSNTGKSYGHLKYEVLGETPGEVLSNIFEHPKYLFSMLFENPGKAYFDGIKTELHYIVLLSGGIALLYKPQFLIMLLPIYAQKLYHNSFVKWGINLHYSIEFSAILTIALFIWIWTWNKNSKFKSVFIIIFTIISLLTSFTVMERRKSKWYSGVTTQIYKKKHYEQSFDVERVHRLLDSIPEDAIVVAHLNLVPHLAFRDKIYTFPYVRDAEYIALLPSSTNYYPMKKKSYFRRIKNLRNRKDFEIIIDNKDFLLFKRIK